MLAINFLYILFTDHIYQHSEIQTSFEGII